MKCTGNLAESCSNNAKHLAWIPEHVDDEFSDIEPSAICDEHAIEIKSFSDFVDIKVISMERFAEQGGKFWNLRSK